MAKSLWSGRFKKGLDKRMKDFSYSFVTDSELLCAELSVNEAYARMLAKMKIVSSGELKKILSGLKAIGKSWKHGDACRLHEKYEDVHTFIQDQLEKRAGAVAKKIHTGRSRNDLVATSTRFYLRYQLNAIVQKITGLEKALVDAAKKAGDSTIPGMTHLRKAQPILLAHHFLAYVEMLEEDKDRLRDALKRVDVLPLGSAALAGSSLPIDQKFLARKLGFKKIASNSLQAVSDRAFLAEILSGLSILWMHLSRFSEDVILWNSEAFGFVELDDAFATGSSLMPQKKNPDVFELTRGKSAVIAARLAAIIGIQKGLPLSYNRDLQEDKSIVFGAIRETFLALNVLAPAVQSMSFNRTAMNRALQDDGLYATDILEYLVRKKVPFSEAHTAVGQLVGYAAEMGAALSGLSLKTWRRFSPKFDADIYRLFDAETSVRAKKTIGSTHPGRVRSAIQKWTKALRSRTS